MNDPNPLHYVIPCSNDTLSLSCQHLLGCYPFRFVQPKSHWSAFSSAHLHSHSPAVSINRDDEFIYYFIYLNTTLYCYSILIYSSFTPHTHPHTHNHTKIVIYSNFWFESAINVVEKTFKWTVVNHFISYNNDMLVEIRIYWINKHQFTSTYYITYFTYSLMYSTSNIAEDDDSLKNLYFSVPLHSNRDIRIEPTCSLLLVHSFLGDRGRASKLQR